MKECFQLLKEYKLMLTRQQIKTLKGQILAGDSIVVNVLMAIFKEMI